MPVAADAIHADDLARQVQACDLLHPFHRRLERLEAARTNRVDRT
jgi:hypothetical protein